MAKLTSIKAKKILHEGVARGRMITPKQRGLFGIIASGKRPTRMGARNRTSNKGGRHG